MRIEGLEERCAPASLGFDFGLVTTFGVFAMSGSKLDITNPQTEIGGDVALGPHATQNFSDGHIDYNLYVDQTANNAKHNNVKLGVGGAVGSVIVTDLAPANAAMIDATTQIATMAPTQTFGNITASTSITSHTTINVIKVNNVALSGSATVTLNGPSNSYFIFNVTGKWDMSGSSKIVMSGGVPITHVLYNIIGTGQQVAFTGSSVANGQFLAVNRDISVSGATVNGQIIGAMNHKIAITSGAKVQVDAPHFQPPCGCKWN